MVMCEGELSVKKYNVRLSEAEREELEHLVRTGKRSAQQITKARILLKADISEAGPGWSDSQIAIALEISVDTVARTRQRLVEEGLASALMPKRSPNSARKKIFDGAAEARLIALACSDPPSGRTRWTLELLAQKAVELKIVTEVSDNTIGRTLKKTRLNPISRSNGSFRPRAMPLS